MLFKIVVTVLFFSLLFSDSYAEDIGIMGENKGGVPNPEDPSPQDFDVISYDVYLDLSEAPSPVMSGLSRVSLSWTQDNPDALFYFHLQDLAVDSLFFDGQAADFALLGNPEDGTSVFAVERVGASTFSAVDIYYSGTMTDEVGAGSWGGVHSESQYLYAMGVGFLNNYVSTTRHWLACYDHPSDKALFRINVVIPKEYEFVSNGLEISRNETEASKTISWEHNYPMSSYLAMFAIGPYQEIKLEAFAEKNYDISIYSPDHLIQKSKTAFAKLPDMLAFFDSIFVPFPFERMGYVLTKIGAMEHQTMVSFPASLVANSPASTRTESVIAHETAHQWFGNMVTCLDFRDAWLNEGFAVFCDALYTEHKYGKDAYYEFLKSKSNIYIKTNSVSDGVEPLYNFDREKASNYPQTIYNKGGLVLAMLREKLGDEVFFNSIKSYLNKHKYGNATSLDLANAFLNNIGNEKKEELVTFFDMWVFGKGWLWLDVEIFPKIGDNGETEIIINQSQDESWGFESDLNLTLEYRTTGNEWKEINFKLNEEIKLTIEDEISENNKSIRIVFGENSLVLAEIKNIVNYSPVKYDNIELLIYPNPANNKLIIATEQGISGSVRVYDINGHEVINQYLNYKKEINISSLNSGTYILNAKINGTIINETFQIKR